MSKMGAILVSGILVAGGRNVSIKLSSRTKHDRITVVVGMEVFSQFWYCHLLEYFSEPLFCTHCFDWAQL